MKIRPYFKVQVGTLAYMTHAYLSDGLCSCKLTVADNMSDHVASTCSMYTIGRACVA